MAIFHASLKALTRSRGQSAVAAAAYRAGIALPDERLGVVHDYSRRSGVEQVRFMMPKDAPAWAADAARLWNAVEAAELRSNSRVARELIVALPHELDASSKAGLAEDIGRVLVGRYGVAVMVALHAPDRAGDERNHHAHLLFTTRRIDGKGFGAKVRCLDDQTEGPREVAFLRERVGALTNARLASADHTERVSHNSLATQARKAEDSGDFESAARLTREPLVHVGRAETAAQRRGVLGERVATNAARHTDHRQALGRFFHQRAVGRAAVSARIVRRAEAAFGTVLSGPVRGTRAAGKDAALLNAQASILEEGTRVAREASQAYLDTLRRALAAHAATVDAYLAATRTTHDREAMLLHCATDPQFADCLRESTTARAALRALQEAIPRRRRRYGVAMATMANEQLRLDALDAERPAAWRTLSRRQWAQKRRAQRAVLDAAHASERRARAAVSDAAQDGIKHEARALRTAIRRVERERRTQERGFKLGTIKRVATVNRTEIENSAPSPATRINRNGRCAP